ncbi:hypothetical protein ERC79_16255 [Rhodococcus sp. ABRD24]|uniref:DDE-type integrase/transposase/recombinase n=1 Tax=Rhodococcus sp. ABRD24 TaxID=2507582 RepID=UPI00103B7F79|nr:DDE-type integrase/transposase/recombinase [Rhodococcus sp. ABRD24]QBJ97316.1 hypothetical protein ERC79_16255 [Rhodococcus sp. ABRD24]
MIDLATLMVVGWQTASHMRTSSITDALQMTVTGRYVRTGAAFHSDHGSPYTSEEFEAFVDSGDARTSVGRTGVRRDNALADLFFATLKKEMDQQQTFGTQDRVRFAVTEYIEVSYNRQRLHSMPGQRISAEALAEYRHAVSAV